MKDEFRKERKEVRELSKTYREICMERRRIENERSSTWNKLADSKKELGRKKAAKCPILHIKEYGNVENRYRYAYCPLRDGNSGTYLGNVESGPFTNYCWFCSISPEEAQVKIVFNKIGETGRTKEEIQ